MDDDIFMIQHQRYKDLNEFAESHNFFQDITSYGGRKRRRILKRYMDLNCMLLPSKRVAPCRLYVHFDDDEEVEKIEVNIYYCLILTFTKELAEITWLLSGTEECYNKFGAWVGAKEFIDFAEAWARALNYTKIQLTDGAHVSGDRVTLSFYKFFEKSRTFYESFGYVPCTDDMDLYLKNMEALEHLGSTPMINIPKIMPQTQNMTEHYINFITQLNNVVTRVRQILPEITNMTEFGQVYLALAKSAASKCKDLSPLEEDVDFCEAVKVMNYFVFVYLKELLNTKYDSLYELVNLCKTIDPRQNDYDRQRYQLLGSA